MRNVCPLALAAFLTLGVPGSALRAQFTLWEEGGKALELGGYLQSLTGLYDLGYDVAETERTSGFNAEVVRLKWMVRFGESVLLEVHDRLQAQVSSAASGLGGGAGFGVSVVPGRSVDLTSDLIEKERLRVWHDVDRLSLTLYTELGDLTLGRQAITWGISNLFPVSDLWAQFSPFELDTEEKPGIDAVRLLTYPWEGVELDAVLADRGSADDLSAGVRASLGLSWGDLYLGGGKLWNEALALAGTAIPVGSYKLRAEGVLPYDLDLRHGRLPRATLGVDWFGGETMVSGEYHFNGIGVSETTEYEQALADPRFARGESYYLGRHYLGALASWSPGNDRLSLALSGMVNLQDPSSIFTPMLTYDFGQETRVTAGGMISFGNAPFVPMETPPGETGSPSLRSEYGMYGDLFFTRVSIYF